MVAMVGGRQVHPLEHSWDVFSRSGCLRKLFENLHLNPIDSIKTLTFLKKFHKQCQLLVARHGNSLLATFLKQKAHTGQSYVYSCDSFDNSVVGKMAEQMCSQDYMHQQAQLLCQVVCFAHPFLWYFRNPFLYLRGLLKHDKRTRTKKNSRALGFRVMVSKIFSFMFILTSLQLTRNNPHCTLYDDQLVQLLLKSRASGFMV